MSIPFEIITKKPIVPSDYEQSDNPRSRSAKCRIAVRTECNDPHKNKNGSIMRLIILVLCSICLIVVSVWAYNVNYKVEISYKGCLLPFLRNRKKRITN